MGKNITIIKSSMHERHTKVNFSVVVLTFNLKVEDFENLSRLWAAILAGRRRELRARLNVEDLVSLNSTKCFKYAQ